MSDPRTRKAQAALMSTADETEASFYEAMQQGDVERMMGLWADVDPIRRIRQHPGFMDFAEDIGLVEAWERIEALYAENADAMTRLDVNAGAMLAAVLVRFSSVSLARLNLYSVLKLSTPSSSTRGKASRT